MDSPAGAIKRRAERKVPLLDDPPLGHLQAVILNRLGKLGSEAYGYNVLEGLSVEFGVWLDQAQVYTIIRKLLQQELIELAGLKEQAGTPPLKIYRLTAAGRAALDVTLAHHTAMVAELSKHKRKATR